MQLRTSMIHHSPTKLLLRTPTILTLLTSTQTAHNHPLRTLLRMTYRTHDSRPLSKHRQAPYHCLSLLKDRLIQAPPQCSCPSDQEGLEPVTGPNATAQVPIPPVGAGQSFGALYTRFYLLLLLTLFLSLNATSWTPPFRRIYFTGLGLVYLSFWIPQLNRNVQRNCRKALNWEYVVGQSILRLMPFAYFYGYSNNVLFAEIDWIGLALLTVWVWIQVVLLISQEIVGPRWFVGKGWAPPAYDYHPILREDEEGDTMPIGFSQATEAGSAPSSPVTDRDGRTSPTLARRGSIVAKEAKVKGKRVFDCAICMQDLEVSVIEAGGPSDQTSGPAGLLARRMYMVTPCRHIFHSACLEGWMKYRLQCPICRETLPPL